MYIWLIEMFLLPNLSVGFLVTKENVGIYLEGLFTSYW